MLRLTLLTLLVGACASSGTPAPKTPAASTSAVTLVHLENGDAACYVLVKQADGTERSLQGSFELCEGGEHDASALIGKQVTYTTEKENVLAAECQGDMDCGKSDEVELVVTLTEVK
jgi:hypothetical protein